MKRRAFSLSLAGAAAATGTGTTWAQANNAGFQEGVEYIALDKRVSTDAPAGKIEVLEFFWYNCPHCNAFEPALEAWIKRLPSDVVLKRVPVAFRDDFEPQQRLFYALEAMGKLPELHGKVFYAIHAEKQSLNTFEAISAWAQKQGLDKAKFEAAYQSFGAASRSKKAKLLQDQYKVQGVPALGIAGRFYTSGAMTATMDKALQVTDFLLAEIRKENQAAQPAKATDKPADKKAKEAKPKA
jgi:thiol:disulfide interchange protein DsbA